MYRLTFTWEPSTTGLQVLAFSHGKRTHSGRYKDEGMFASCLRGADISKKHYAEIVDSAKKAWANPGMPVCCEELEMSEREMEALGLIHVSPMSAAR